MICVFKIKLWASIRRKPFSAPSAFESGHACIQTKLPSGTQSVVLSLLTFRQCFVSREFKCQPIDRNQSKEMDSGLVSGKRPCTKLPDSETSRQGRKDPISFQGTTTERASCGVNAVAVCLLVGCLTSQQHPSVSQGRICTDNFTCCHTETEAADQTFHLTQSQYTDTGPTSPSADPTTPGAWQGSHWSANFSIFKSLV